MVPLVPILLVRVLIVRPVAISTFMEEQTCKRVSRAVRTWLESSTATVSCKLSGHD